MMVGYNLKCCNNFLELCIGRLVTVKYLRLELYHNKFPESKQALKSLQPSTTQMTSLARPYHRSTLEMT